jgi:hypothetical protein
MADDIILTVHVRDMTRGQFQRLDREMNGLRGTVRQLGQDGNQANERMRRLDQSLGAVQGRMRRLHQTGQMTSREMDHMRQSLAGVNREALNAVRSGEITRDQYNRLRTQIDQTRGAFDHLDRDIRLHRTQLRGVGNDAERAAMATRRLQLQEERLRMSEERLRQSAERLRMSQGRVVGANRSISNSSNLATRTVSNMRGALIGVAVVLIASLLPTIGALAPMLAGIAAIAGVAALAFMGLSRPTSKLTQDQKKFKEGLKPLTNEFRELQRVAQHAVLPGLTKSIPAVTRAVKALNPVIKIGGKALGELVDKIAKGIGSKDFMGPFLKNVKMGTDWVIKFVGSFGKFLKAFFEFGTKSKPALDAWQDLLGGFMDRGLPSMFKNMESGVKGASDYLLGLSAVINDGLLPGLGRLLGKFMEVFGPSLGRMLTTFAGTFVSLSDIVGGLMEAAAPLVRVFLNIGEAIAEIGRIGISSLGNLLKDLGGGLAQSLADAFGGSGLGSLVDNIRNSEGQLRAIFTGIGDAVFSIAENAVMAAPIIMNMMTKITTVALATFGAFVNGAATAFGWIPGIGDKIKGASKAFKDFSQDVQTSMADATAAASDFRDSALPNLSRAELKFNVDQAKSALQDIKTQLKDPELTKKRRAILEADKSTAESNIKDAERKLGAFDHKRAKAKLDATASSFFNVFNRVNALKLQGKSAKVTAKDSASGKLTFIQRLLNQINGTVARTTVVTSYQQVRNQGYSGNSATGGHAHGGRIRRFADGGGAVSGPGSESSDSIPAMLSDGEYVVRASSVRKYGTSFLDDVNSGNLHRRGFAKGGLTKQQQAEKDARSAMSGQFGISFFGKIAGYKHDPYEVATGKPQSLGELVSALNGLRSQIKAAFHGKQESSLLHQLTNAGKALIKYEKKLSDVNKKLDAAKTKLDDLKSAAASLKESVTSGVMSATDVTRVASNDNNVTMTDVMATMRESLDKSSAFASALKSLQSRGVSKDIINQIAQAGISGGGLETAGAILSASDSEISQMNAMQKQIDANAKSAGKTASDSMYAAGIKAAEGLVKGLTAKKKDIEDAMMKIAKSMEKAIKKALGIKSPSRVMMKVGHHTAEGFALGMTKNRKVPHAWESMLNVPSGGAPVGAARGGGDGVYSFPIYVGGKFLDEVILDTNRRLVRTRGGDVQKVFGRK